MDGLGRVAFRLWRLPIRPSGGGNGEDWWEARVGFRPGGRSRVGLAWGPRHKPARTGDILSPGRGRRLAFPICARQRAAHLHACAAHGRVPRPAAAAYGTAAQIIAPLIEMICPEI